MLTKEYLKRNKKCYILAWNNKGGNTLFIDLSLGIIAFVGISLLFGKPFYWSLLFAAIIFAHLPDSDFIPFTLLRKRFRLVSHHLIHFPLLYIPLGMGALFASRKPMLAVLFGICSIAHFIHDSMCITGIRWLWPLGKKAYTIQKFRFREATKRDEYYESLKRTRKNRNIIDEVIIRVEGPTFGDTLLLSLALFSLLLFFILR